MYIKKRALFTLVSVLTLSGCASYSITEKEMTDYLSDEIHVDKSVGIPGFLYAQVNVENVDVQIGRIAADRISVFANTTADVQMLDEIKQNLSLTLEFSAVPEYDKETGEIYLKSLRLEKFEDKNQKLSPELTSLLKPAVSIIGYALSNEPAYKLNSDKLKESLIKSAEPNLVIKNNKLVIELFN
ncbi:MULTISPECIES: DUF1439 domain-containing protein [Aliivibrio]|uniref:DUF1439 domain-containing protein n=1 Tax=Aliivibrio finisterrensis TaxID=511998 RepID=A0A4V1Z8Z7_9GAMM|nr:MULTISPECIES: DUF1439 domain-containing protein [Aliivibrio]MDD9173821.1 DUF1439 domain-containing protein [Aliivibrio sp. S3TY1]MDD9178717.1 DUF1439 domain-containing protein [Aliivibrio sp. A6]MDD9190898.1 DUF1439 domain-containing protein [Aliivibrio sp. S2TY2]RYU46321.1 DUF1439 domain-containing protein [Aliivibrio finisterrensis]RYU52448.1 DUF1439 domain-containing protein [Aliivibrio finisterrensis]